MLSRFALTSGLRACRDGIVVPRASMSILYPWETGAKQLTPAEQAAEAEKYANMSLDQLKAEYRTLAPQPIVESPERDYKNFPTMRRLAEVPVRHMWIPESWFQSLYKTTGVSGPYVLMATLSTFLMSKEYFIFGFESNILFTGWLFMVIVVKKFGPSTNQFLDSAIQEEREKYSSFEKSCKEELSQAVSNYQKEIDNGAGIGMLHTAKRENVGLQLEAEYRERQKRVYSEVKKRLDYQVDTDNVKRRVEQAHMVNWIIDNVKKSITPEQEKQNLQSCIAKLKTLSPA